MTDTNTTQQADNANAATTATSTPVSMTKGQALDALINCAGFYGPEEGEKINSVIETVTSASGVLGVEIIQNFTDETDPPEGYGISIQPISKRGAGVQCVIIALVPTVSTIAEDEKGAGFIADVVGRALTAKLVSLVRPRGKNATLNSRPSALPLSIAEFLAPSARTANLAAFRKLAGMFVDALKAKGADNMNAKILRGILESAPYAEAMYPSVSQDKWEHILDLMIKKAESDRMDAQIFYHWKDTRANVNETDNDLDLDGFDNLFGGNDSTTVSA